MSEDLPPPIQAATPSGTPGVRPRRRLRNYVLAPKSQFRTAAMIFFVGFVFISILFAILLSRLSELVQTLANLSVDPQQAAMVTGNTSTMLMATYFFLLLTFLLTATFLALSITHRFLGPAVPIARHVKALIDGNYESRVSLRKNDEFQELATDLNTLAEKLARKS